MPQSALRSTFKGATGTFYLKAIIPFTLNEYSNQSTLQYVTLEGNLTSKPFLCKDRIMHAPSLGGVSMEFMDTVRPLHNAMCVFGGNDCSFQGLFKVLEHEKKYQFMFGGTLWILPDRISCNTRASTATHEDPVVVVGLARRQSDVQQSYNNIVRPFATLTWILIISYYCGVCLVHVSLACLFAHPRTFTNVCRHTLCDYKQSENTEQVRMLNKIAVRSLRFVVTASTILIILFYEITIVNYVFLSKARTLEKDIRNLSPADLATYAVVKDDGTELLFRSLADPNGKYKKKKPPWWQCVSLDDCYDNLLDPAHPAKFLLTYERGLRYKLRKSQTCDHLTVFKTKSPLSSVSAGWYYGYSFPRSVQIAIDKAILGHRLQHKIQDLLNQAYPQLRCGTPTVINIQPGVIGWLLLTISLVCMIPILLASIGAVFCRRASATKAEHVGVWD